MTKSVRVPQLRFPEFSGEWEEKRLGGVAKITTGNTPSTNIVEYYDGEKLFVSPIDIQGNRYVKNTKTTLTDLGFKKGRKIDKNSVLFVCIGSTIGKVAQSFEECLTNQQINSLTCSKNNDNDFLFSLLQKNGNKIKLLSGVQAVPLLNKSDFSNLKFHIPPLPEQTKIASFLSTVDKKIEQLTKKKELLGEHKKGLMQKIFSQELRFKDDEGNPFEDWRERKFNEVLVEHKDKSTGAEEVYSVSVHKGLVNQIEHLGRSFAAKDTSNYNLAKPNDIIYTKSPTGDFPFGIIKQSFVDKDVIISPLYGVFTPETPELGYMLNVYFESVINVHNYLHSIIQKGAKNTINITNTNFLSKGLKLPVSKDEQIKTGSFLKKIDAKINQVKIQLAQTQQFKKALLQQMFV